MQEENQSPGIRQNKPLPMPDPEQLKPAGLSDAHKRYIYYGVSVALVLLILTNVMGSKQSATANRPKGSSSAQQGNPSPAQIRDWENNLQQAEAQLQEGTKDRQRQLDAARALQQPAAPITPEELQRAPALNEAALARQQFESAQPNGGQLGQEQTQKSQIATEQAQQAYKSLFADNVVRQETASKRFDSDLRQEPEKPLPAATAAESALKVSADRKAIDFDNAQPTVWLPEGTVIEAVLTNRLDADAAGPVDCMITTSVYQPDTRVLLLPQGARVLGEASKVSSLGQARLAVAFHRVLVPGLRMYSIPLDKPVPGLGQAGEVGLHDRVDNHYASIFGASIAIGAIGGLAQIGNGSSSFGYDPSAEFRNGVSQSTAQSSSRVLDRFLNRMPSITVREGTRVKIILTDDLQLPIYEPSTAAQIQRSNPTSKGGDLNGPAY